jgi:hypothetical protein
MDSNTVASKAAAVVTPKQTKPLPALASPTVKVPDQLRETIAKRCAEIGESFSVATIKMWIDLLKKEKRIAPDMVIDLSAQRGMAQARTKEQLATYELEITTLRAELAALKAAVKK